MKILAFILYIIVITYLCAIIIPKYTSSDILSIVLVFIILCLASFLIKQLFKDG